MRQFHHGEERHVPQVGQLRLDEWLFLADHRHPYLAASGFRSTSYQALLSLPLRMASGRAHPQNRGCRIKIFFRRGRKGGTLEMASETPEFQKYAAYPYTDGTRKYP